MSFFDDLDSVDNLHAYRRKLEDQYGLSSGLLTSMAAAESAGRSNAVSPKGARGLMQFMPATARELGIDPDDDFQATEGAARYVSRLKKQFDGDEVKAVAAYNAGAGNVAKHGGVPPFRETRSYVRKVFDALVRPAMAGEAEDLGFAQALDAIDQERKAQNPPSQEADFGAALDAIDQERKAQNPPSQKAVFGAAPDAIDPAKQPPVSTPNAELSIDISSPGQLAVSPTHRDVAPSSALEMDVLPIPLIPFAPSGNRLPLKVLDDLRAGRSTIAPGEMEDILRTLELGHLKPEDARSLRQALELRMPTGAKSTLNNAYQIGEVARALRESKGIPGFTAPASAGRVFGEGLVSGLSGNYAQSLPPEQFPVERRAAEIVKGEARQAHPLADVAGQLAGGAVNMIPFLGATRQGMNALGILPNTLKARIAEGLVAGVPQGALMRPESSERMTLGENLAARIDQAALSAALGMGGDVALYGLGKAVGPAWRRYLNSLTDEKARAALQAEARQAGFNDVDSYMAANGVDLRLVDVEMTQDGPVIKPNADLLKQLPGEENVPEPISVEADRRPETQNLLPAPESDTAASRSLRTIARDTESLTPAPANLPPDEIPGREPGRNQAPTAAPAAEDWRQVSARADEAERLARAASDVTLREQLLTQALSLRKQADTLKSGETPKLSPAERMRARLKIDPEKDDLITAMRKLGGLDVQTESDWQGRFNHLRRKIPGLPGIEQKAGRGRTLDDMAESLRQFGYVTDKADLEARLFLASRGNEVWSNWKNDFSHLDDGRMGFPSSTDLDWNYEPHGTAKFEGNDFIIDSDSGDIVPARPLSEDDFLRIIDEHEQADAWFRREQASAQGLEASAKSEQPGGLPADGGISPIGRAEDTLLGRASNQPGQGETLDQIFGPRDENVQALADLKRAKDIRRQGSRDVNPDEGPGDLFGGGSRQVDLVDFLKQQDVRTRHGKKEIPGETTGQGRQGQDALLKNANDIIPATERGNNIDPRSQVLIDKWEKIITNQGNGRERLSDYLASLSLARNFGEKFDDYATKEGLTDFVAWARNAIKTESSAVKPASFMAVKPEDEIEPLSPLEVNRKQFFENARQSGIGATKNLEVSRQEHDLAILRRLFADEIAQDNFGHGIRKTIDDIREGIQRNWSKRDIVDRAAFAHVDKQIRALYQQALRNQYAVPEFVLADHPDLSTAPGVSIDDIPMELATRAHNGTSWTPDTRGQQDREGYVRYMNDVWGELSRLAQTEDRRLLARIEFSNYRKEYLKRYKGLLQRRSGLVSSMIAGPSKFPTGRANKANSAYDKALGEFFDWNEKTQKRIKQRLAPVSSQRISSDDADALVKLQSKIQDAEQLQDRMKAVNTIVRNNKLSDDDKVSKIVEAKLLSEKQARDALKPDFMGRTGFADYQLKNNNAEIRRLKGRLDELSQARAQSSVEREAASSGIRIVDDVDANRVRIYFPDKPGAEIRTKLKQNGFRWSPTEGAWQRQRGERAKELAEEISGVKFNQVEVRRAQYDTKTQDMFGLERETMPLPEGMGRSVQPDAEATGNAGDVPAARAIQRGRTVEHETVKHFSSVIDRITTPEDAAYVTRQIANQAQENLLAIITDAEGRPIEIVRHTLGGQASSQLFPNILVGSAFQNPKAKYVWLSHNHPSGTAKLSTADIENANKPVSRLLEDSGLIYKGILAVTHKGTFAHIGPDSSNLKMIENGSFINHIQEHVKSEKNAKLMVKLGVADYKNANMHSIPVVERVFSDIGAKSLGKEITSPQKAFQFAEGKTGIILLDNQNTPQVFLPMTLDEMRKLRMSRPDEPFSGHGIVFREMARGNSGNAILSISKDDYVSSLAGDRIDAINNVRKFFRQINSPDAKLLDVVTTIRDPITGEYGGKSLAQGSYDGVSDFVPYGTFYANPIGPIAKRIAIDLGLHPARNLLGGGLGAVWGGKESDQETGSLGWWVNVAEGAAVGMAAAKAGSMATNGTGWLLRKSRVFGKGGLLDEWAGKSGRYIEGLPLIGRGPEELRQFKRKARIMRTLIDKQTAEVGQFLERQFSPSERGQMADLIETRGIVKDHNLIHRQAEALDQYISEAGERLKELGMLPEDLETGGYLHRYYAKDLDLVGMLKRPFRQSISGTYTLARGTDDPFDRQYFSQRAQDRLNEWAFVTSEMDKVEKDIKAWNKRASRVEKGIGKEAEDADIFMEKYAEAMDSLGEQMDELKGRRDDLRKTEFKQYLGEQNGEIRSFFFLPDEVPRIDTGIPPKLAQIDTPGPRLDKRVMPQAPVNTLSATDRVWTLRGANEKQALLHRDWTPAERKSWGEIKDAGYRYVRGMQEVSHDLSIATLFDRIARHSDWATADGDFGLANGWVKVPDSNVGKGSPLRRYGALSGMWVKPEIWNAIRNAGRNPLSATNIGKLYLGALNKWKVWHTADNPVTHFNNIFSNTEMMYLAGYSPKDLSEGIRHLRLGQKSDLFKEAEDAGLFGNDWVSSTLGGGEGNASLADLAERLRNQPEIPDAVLTSSLLMDWKASLKDSMESIRGASGRAKGEEVLRALLKPTRAAGRLAAKPYGVYANAMRKAYRAEDDLFKMAVYQAERAKGVTPEVATQTAERFFFDYQDLPDAVKFARDFPIGSPFLSYTYLAAQAMVRNAIERPEKILALLAGFEAANYVFTTAGTDNGPNEYWRMMEAEEQLSPGWEKGRSVMGLRNMLHLPSPEGYRLSLSRAHALGNPFAGESGGREKLPKMPVLNELWGSSFLGGSPLHALVDIAINEDWKGKPIYHPKDPDAERIRKSMAYLYQSWAPSSPVVPGSYHQGRIMEGIANQAATDREASKDSLPIQLIDAANAISEALGGGQFTGLDRQENPILTRDALLGSVGVKLRPMRPEQWAEFAELDSQRDQLKSMDRARRILRDVDEKRRTPSQGENAERVLEQQLLEAERAQQKNAEALELLLNRRRRQ